jgi:hypothetical protein
MAFTVRIPQSYATRIINAIEAGPAKDFPSTRLNVQPDGSLLVRSESAESPYEAHVDIFNQNLGIPIAAIRGFETLADTSADANRYRTGIATTSEKNAAIDASGLGAPSRAIAPTPFTGAGDVQDLTFDERRAIGEMPFGPYQITPAQLLTPSFYRDQQAAAQLGEGQGEGTSIAGGLFRDSKVKPTSVGYVPPDPFAPQTDAVPKIVGDTGDEPVDMPANLPPFWQERYDEYLNLSPYLQSVIIRDQVKDFIALQPYRGIAVEQDDGVSGAAGADVGLEELQKILGQTTGATVNPDGSISFVPGTVDPSTIDVTRRIPDPLQLQGYANTGLQDILNIFYANPDRYISEIPLFEDVYDPVSGQVTGQRQVGTQQVLSPVAQAALQAFSTQRGAESADIASRFGTATPFGAIAGLGGTAEQALGLAELQARAGVTNPFAALGTGSAIGDIGTILRGGLTTEEQLALEGLQARGGLTAQERLAEQRLAALSPLLQASPGTLGGLSRVLGGEEQLRSLFSPFTSYAAQPVTGQGAPIQVSQQPFAPSPRIGGFQKTGEYIAPQPLPYVPSQRTGDPKLLDVVVNLSSQQASKGQAPRQTVGGYQRAGLFDRGGIEAEAGMTGEELGRYLGQVTPFGGGSPRGSLGAQLA